MSETKTNHGVVEGKAPELTVNQLPTGQVGSIPIGATVDLVDIREAQDTDVPYVLDSWLRASFSHMQSEAFHAGRLQLAPTLEQYAADFTPLQSAAVQRARCLIACLKGRPRKILGYLVFTPAWSTVGATTNGPPIVVWCQTKREHQRTSVARKLFAAACIEPSAPVVYVSNSPILRRLRAQTASWTYLPLRQWLNQP